MNPTLEVTWQGSENCFQKCAPIICQRLQEEKFQWKRSDKEFPVGVQLHVEFVKFSSNTIRNSNMFSFPPKQIPAVCHLFFVDVADPDKYRNEVRSQLAEWFSILRDADTNDWFIVFDSMKARETKMKNPLLEKLRSDFSKYTSRIVEIFSIQTKGAPILIRHIAETILVSLDALVQSYEAALKGERENCFFAQWTFCPYFLDQLQIAQLFLSLKLYDLALAQLEEVDALLSLLISHFAANLLKPKWIAVISQTSPVVSLCSTMEEIAPSLKTLFNGERNDACLNHTKIRLILLAFQLCAVQQRYESNVVVSQTSSDTSRVQTAEILLNYGFKMLKHGREERALMSQRYDPNDSFSRVLWCLELIVLAEKLCEIGRITSAAESVCNIWMIICREIEVVRRTIEDKATSLESVRNTFYELIPTEFRECLSSMSTFDAHYVKWHETAIAILKHMNWNRNAKLTCLALARFHANRGNLTAAVQFYSKLLRYLRNDRWFLLYYSLLSEVDEIRTNFSKSDQATMLADLACNKNKKIDERVRYFENFLEIFSAPLLDDDEKIQLDVTLSWIKLQKVNVTPSKLFCGSKFSWRFRIENKFPRDFDFVSIYLCYNCFDSSNELHRQKSQSPVLTENAGDNYELISVNTFRTNYLKRKSDVYDPVQCTSTAGQLYFGETRLKSGENEFVVENKANFCGVYQPDHVHFCLPSLSFVLPVKEDNFAHCFVENSESFVTLEKCSTDCLWVGITELLKLSIRMGSENNSETTENFTVSLESIDNELSFPESEKNFYRRNLIVPFMIVNEEWSTTIPVFVGLNGQQEDRHCRIFVSWMNKTYEFNFVFKSLMAWSFETHVIGSKTLVEFIVTNFSQEIVRVETAELELFMKEKTPKLTAKLLNTIKMDLAPHCPQHIVWEMSSREYYREGLVSFTYAFGNNDEKFECWAKLVFNELLTIEACCQVASESAVCRVEWPCDFVISLKADHLALRCADLSVIVLVDQKFWRCLEGSVVNVTLKENGLGQTAFRLTPQCVGYLPLPSVDVRVLSPANVACQVYVRSKGKQIHVLSSLPRAKVDSKSKILS